MNAEGCVELEALRASYNPARDPRVADGELSADEVETRLTDQRDGKMKLKVTFSDALEFRKITTMFETFSDNFRIN